ncbi:conserved domain protein [Haemophilus pittmaniae HK 85]|uniref:Conserved domain protein n=1 Tax=Haemophilus pittmaniae HK 85 TaxID=1035188 RepID=F9QBU2_9PAST|nr:conserved domain protein [Haemophilus pittmaniae HK 85]
MLQCATILNEKESLMARQKKTRRITDVMPIRKTDKKPALAPKGKN